MELFPIQSWRGFISAAVITAPQKGTHLKNKKIPLSEAAK